MERIHGGAPPGDPHLKLKFGIRAMVLASDNHNGMSDAGRKVLAVATVV